MNNLYDLFTSSLASGNIKIILLFISFLGGIIASISPCSLAMLPIVIGYIGGYGETKTSKVVLQLLSFILGSAIIFSIIGIICALTGHVFISMAGNYFPLIIAGIILIMGLNLCGFLDLQIPTLIKKIPQSDGSSLFLYPMLLGAIFAIGGTPCSTPILASIMGIASVSSNLLFAVALLFLFSLGQGIILLIAGLCTSVVKKLGNVIETSEILLKASGIVLILAAIYLYYKVFAPFF